MTNSEMPNDKIKKITQRLFDYCQSNDWGGYDPYDALNSEIFKRLPFLDSKWPRIALTQLLKRSPLNFRPFLLIPKTQNPKALALFLMAFLKLERLGLLKDKGLIPLMVKKIIDLRSNNNLLTVNRELLTVNREPSFPSTVNREPLTVKHYWCWGYSFPWQGRSVLAPRGEPNLVCTVFVANALLDYYESNRCQPETVNCKLSTDNLLLMATSAADYLLNELYWEDDKGNAGFSYPTPSCQTRVHNANFLGAALFCRIYKHSGEKKYLEPALKAASYSAKMQQEDGSWAYGEDKTQKWVDNFHTGFNLGALRTINQCLDTNEFEPNVRRGFEFYKKHFFREDGAPKYFHDRTYPFDVHSIAQSIISLTELSDLDHSNIKLAKHVFEWAIANMWDERGFFYYQMTPYYKNKISYMRWSQAWMLLALSTMLGAVNN